MRRIESAFKFSVNENQSQLEIHDNGNPYIGEWKIQTRETQPTFTG